MLHKNLVPADNHVLHAWTYLDAGERTTATGFVSADIGKLAWQISDNTFWVLTTTGPVWIQLGGVSTLSSIDEMSFSPNGVIEIDGAAGWDDITSDIAVKGAGSNDPAWSVFRNGIYAYEFSATVMKEAWLTFHPNHNHAPGTDVFLHAHISPNNTGTGVVRIGFEYTIGKGHGQGAGSIFPATTTVYAEINIAAPRQYEHLIPETAAISDTKFEVDSLVLCRIFRDAAHANDTFSGTVHIFTADIHHQINRFSTKNRAPNFYL